MVANLDTHIATTLLAGRTLRTVLALTPAELTTTGLSEIQTVRLRALASIVERAGTERLAYGDLFKDPTAIFRHYYAQMRDLRVEQFRVVLLDGKHRMLREELVSQGTLTMSPVHPREVFAPAIRHGAAAIVVVHNHPSGDPSPSADDMEITRRLVEAGELVGIHVVDHVIVGDNTWCSLADRGLLRGL